LCALLVGVSCCAILIGWCNPAVLLVEFYVTGMWES